jgi:UDP-N-acetylglucosamine 1-carboxyvinyltransferase
MTPPGGCVIGRRNVDSHFEVVEAFGGDLQIAEKKYTAVLLKPKGATIFLKETSVTATENAMLLAAGVAEKSIITNAAAEPHVDDLAQVLNKMGADVTGSGTNSITVSGTNSLHGFTHRIMPDHIEAGTFAIAAAATGGDLVIHDARREHLQITAYILDKMNVSCHFLDENNLHIKPSQLKSSIKKIQVGTWPGFPTDLMSPMIVLATQCEGVTLCHDWMYESRMFFVDKLIAMGAQITLCDPHRALVAGPTQLKGQRLSSPDIRAGVALVIAAISARGTSHIDNAELIDRGYENIVKRLNNIGAKITREKF